jgi:hypothetical protein
MHRHGYGASRLVISWINGSASAKLKGGTRKKPGFHWCLGGDKERQEREE